MGIFFLVCASGAATPSSALAFGKPRNPEPLPPPTGPEHGSFVLKILSYNIHGVPVASDHERYAEIGKILAERRKRGDAPHIVAIQEAIDPRTDELGLESGYPYSAEGPGAGFLVLRSGMEVWSEFPVSAPENKPYSHCISWDCAARKGMMRVDVLLPGVPHTLSLYNTHLQSDPDTDPVTPRKYTRFIREKQIHEIRDFLGATRALGRFSIFPGDFNVVFGDEQMNLLSYFTGMRDSAEACVHAEGCSGREHAAASMAGALDHHLFNASPSSLVRIFPLRFENVFSEKVNGRRLSDHDGVEVDYLLTW